MKFERAAGYAAILIGLVFILSGITSASTGGGGGTTTTTGGVTYTTATTSTNVCNTCGTSGLQAFLDASSFNAYAGASVTFVGSGSGGSPAYWYSWTFGDGTVQTPYVEGPSGASISHTYAPAGTFTLVFNVKDSSGSIATAAAQVYVAPVTQSTTTATVIITVISPGSSPYYNNPSPVYGATVTLGSLTATTASGTGQAEFSNVQPVTYSVMVDAGSSWKVYSSSLTVDAPLTQLTVDLTPSCFPACGLSILGGWFMGISSDFLAGFAFLAAGVFLVRRRG